MLQEDLSPTPSCTAAWCVVSGLHPVDVSTQRVIFISNELSLISTLYGIGQG